MLAVDRSLHVGRNESGMSVRLHFLLQACNPLANVLHNLVSTNPEMMELAPEGEGEERPTPFFDEGQINDIKRLKTQAPPPAAGAGTMMAVHRRVGTQNQSGIFFFSRLFFYVVRDLFFLYLTGHASIANVPEEIDDTKSLKPQTKPAASAAEGTT